MKVIICGKGGSGKSTISVLIAKAMDKRGHRVLLIDADESNAGIHRLLGVSQPVIFMDSLGGKKAFKEKLNNKDNDNFFKQKMTIDDIPAECIARTDGISLLVIGKIHSHGEGCACPMGLLSKTVLSRLDISEKEVVIIDAEAGVEHFGRGVDTGCDLIFCVVDPSYESFMLADKLQNMAGNAGINMFFILNRVNDQVEDVMLTHVNIEKVAAKIPQSEAVYMDSLKGDALKVDIPEIESACRIIEKSPKTKGGPMPFVTIR